MDFVVDAVGNYNFTNQTLLTDIAKDTYVTNVREAAVKNPSINDQALLAKLAKSDKEEGSVRIAAANRLNDKSLAQSVFADIIRNDEVIESFADARKEAVEHITDQTLLEKVAKNDDDIDVRIAAAEKINDKAFAQLVYADLAKNFWSIYNSICTKRGLAQYGVGPDGNGGIVRLIVVDKLNDTELSQRIYSDIAKNDDNSNDRKLAVRKFTNQTLLAEIAKSDKDEDVREAAAKRLDIIKKKVPEK